MALWEIRLIDQPPVRVEVEDTRNLSQEHNDLLDQFRQAASVPRWKFWAQPASPDPLWTITDTVRLPVALITGVLICKRVRTRATHKPIPIFGQE